MCRRTTVFLLALVLGPFVFSWIAAAQDDQPATSPWNVAAQFSIGPGTDGQAGERRVVQSHYVGKQTLRGGSGEIGSR
jgi:hypothetical protein